ncbi:Protein of unknown function [Pyronema omphalodes CBS 100304]|uniref:Uncharacterized protein n=1 Tax=Pyronema omphalodes (strain CBS 100304) TaxID=1076935 RepID=U4L639_PYROM|nr:Protein of unknown function [Pyronema omphalodes CBS 100304]
MKLISEEAINDWWVDVRSSEGDRDSSNSNNSLYKRVRVAQLRALTPTRVSTTAHASGRAEEF